MKMDHEFLITKMHASTILAQYRLWGYIYTHTHTYIMDLSKWDKKLKYTKEMDDAQIITPLSGRIEL